MPRQSDHLAATLERHTAALQRRQSAEAVDTDPFNTDEWDPSRGAFWQHAVAGSVAGVAEHSLMYPVDTIKTHMQVGNTAKFSELVAAGGVPRMWRGVQTMFTGCVPAHAAYFSIYETCKPAFTNALEGSRAALKVDDIAGTVHGSTSEAVGAGVAVSMATVAHDLFMTPMDVLKQRLQLGRAAPRPGTKQGAVRRSAKSRSVVGSLLPRSRRER